MAAIEPLAIVRLGATDAAHGLMLSTEAGWNQSEADWRFFLTQAVTVGVRADGRLIATAALLRHDAAEAWISMVLVTANWRRQGLATRLVAHCLAAAAEHKDPAAVKQPRTVGHDLPPPVLSRLSPAASDWPDCRTNCSRRLRRRSLPSSLYGRAGRNST